MSSQSAPRTKRPPLARYVNYFEVSHNAVEFLLDFGQYQPETRAVVLHSRMACGPTHAKLLVGVLANAVRQFEAEHGAIPDAAALDDPLDALYAPQSELAVRADRLRQAR
jgi:hypothetical protein